MRVHEHIPTFSQPETFKCQMLIDHKYKIVSIGCKIVYNSSLIPVVIKINVQTSST